MFIPDRAMEDWFADLVMQCGADKSDRMEKGNFFRNVYLTGDSDGQTAVYNKTNDSIEDLSAYTCSSVDLRYAMSYPGGGSSVQRAKCQAAAHELLDQSRATELDTLFEEATTWSYVLGKTFIRMNWSADGLEPHLIMPEMMGVYRPDLDDLDSQEAFTFSYYVTESQLRMMLGNHPDRVKMYRKIMSQGGLKRGMPDAPDQQASMKQVLLGGYQPYTAAGNSNGQRASGIVQWLAGPYPTFSPKVVASLVRIDELWVKDDARSDGDGRREWTTIVGTGNVIMFGKEQRMNLFADAFDPDKPGNTYLPDDGNPLAFRHPFIEFCPNRMKGYFWGRPEITNLALLQKSLNDRVNGINKLLRLQEDPPIAFLGGMQKDDKIKNKLTKPGGWMHDPDPTAKPPTVLAPQLPEGLFATLQEYERMFDVVTGMTPMLQGVAQGSIRSQGQAGVMTQNATPKFKKKAIRVERSIQTAATLLFLMLKAKSTNLITAWVRHGPGEEHSPELKGELIDPSVEAPAPGMVAVQFYMHEMPNAVKVVVDSHSSSPAFGDETEQKAILLRKANAMTTPRFIEAINPPETDAIIAEVDTLEFKAAEAQKAAQAAAAQQQAHGKGGKK